MKSGNVNFLEPSGPLQACNGTALPLPKITTFCFIILLTDSYNDRLLGQFFFIPNRNHKFMDIIVNCSTPCLNQFCWNLINTRWFVAFSFSIANSSSKARDSGTSGSAVCISVCLISLTPCTSIFSNWEKWFFYLAKIMCQSAPKSPISFFDY